MDQVNRYTCTCPPGYTGLVCERGKTLIQSYTFFSSGKVIFQQPEYDHNYCVIVSVVFNFFPSEIVGPVRWKTYQPELQHTTSKANIMSKITVTELNILKFKLFGRVLFEIRSLDTKSTVDVREDTKYSSVVYFSYSVSSSYSPSFLLLRFYTFPLKLVVNAELTRQ